MTDRTKEVPLEGETSTSASTSSCASATPSGGRSGRPRRPFTRCGTSSRSASKDVEGDAALAPVPAIDEAVWEIGRLLRATHDAQVGFAHAEHRGWQWMVGSRPRGEVVCHNERRPGWAETWDRDQDRYLVQRDLWFRRHRATISGWLT